VTGTTERVGVASGGGQANGLSEQPAISADGHHVAFESSAPNLVAGDTNGSQDVFVRHRLTGMTERVSVTSKPVFTLTFAGDVPSPSPREARGRRRLPAVRDHE
jgi:hypothetical protein